MIRKRLIYFNGNKHDTITPPVEVLTIYIYKMVWRLLNMMMGKSFISLVHI